MNEVTRSVPLTAGQKMRLIVETLPILFFMAALFYALRRLDSFSRLSALCIFAFIGLGILVLGFQAMQRVRDLTSGKARVQSDRLLRSWRSHLNGTSYHGKFGRLGKLTLTYQTFRQGQAGMGYRVIYSPASKIVWRLESLG